MTTQIIAFVLFSLVGVWLLWTGNVEKKRAKASKILLPVNMKVIRNKIIRNKINVYV